MGKTLGFDSGLTSAKTAAAVLALACAVLFGESAYAEVCDKIAGESWRPEHGPVVPFPGTNPPTTLLFLFFWSALGLIPATTIRRRWIGLVASFGAGSVLLFFGFGSIAYYWVESAILLDAVREGCLLGEPVRTWFSIGAVLCGIICWVVGIWKASRSGPAVGSTLPQ